MRILPCKPLVRCATPVNCPTLRPLDVDGLPSSPAATKERLRRLDRLLQRVLPLAEDERRHCLASLPNGDRDLAAQLAAMLERAAHETGTFLRHSPGMALRDRLGPESADDRAGDTVGPYRLVIELGHGGMSTVWLAECLEHPSACPAALKLPNAGPGSGSALRLAREAAVLSCMDHPGVVRMLASGVTETGRRWLALERVQGQPIDQYIREKGLGLHGRVSLFMQLAAAVAHAHARGFVHRDIKPGNVFVTTDGTVRLLDFGMAKALAVMDTDTADLTRECGRPLTPDYAAPEMAGGRPVGATADVYSLGVLLHELLVGERPYRLGWPGASAIEQAILSTRVRPASRCVKGNRRLARQLRGHIDPVTARAMRKHAGDRYASVEAMACDLGRHLSGLPPDADRRRDRLAVASAFRAGHWAPVAAAMAATLLLGFCCGVCVSLGRTLGA